MSRKIAFTLFALGLSSQVFSQQAIIGGNVGKNGPYAALVSPTGIVTSLTLPEDAYSIQSVAINDAQAAIIGGGSSSSSSSIPYAALVSPTGVVTSLDLTSVSGKYYIHSVAINDTQTAIIGGGESYQAITSPLYAAFVSPIGDVTPLKNILANGIISSVAINDAQTAIIGGGAGTGINIVPYVALVSPDGYANPLPSDSLPLRGMIDSVAINNAQAAIIGGHDNITGAYAALVSPTRDVTKINISTSTTSGEIFSVAINDAQVAIIGGSDDTGAYAAFVSPTGDVVTPTIGIQDPENGQINSVAINDAQAAIIGGFNGSGGACAVLVSPDGSATQLLDLQAESIQSVAINEAQAAIIGGTANDGAYVALVSPTGFVTQLTGLSGAAINSVAISSPLSAVTPTSVGPYNSVFNSALATSFAMQSHITTQHKHLWTSKTPQNVSMLADNDLLVDANELQATPKRHPSYTLWFAPFNDFFHLDHQGSIPALTNEVAGGIAALDYKLENDVIGGGIAYAFDYAHYAQSLGHAKINQEMGVLFGSFQRGPVFINATIWGGLYQSTNERHSLPIITSIGKTHGWIFTPHLELSGIVYRNAADWLALEPFAMLDWVNDWQKHFTEHGPSGFNLVVPHQYSSLLRSEAGLRFYERLCYGWGDIRMEEKASYINQAPFHVQNATTFFVGAVSSFAVATGSSRDLNLGGVEWNCSFIPKNDRYPYGSLDLQGEFGSSLQSYFVGLEIGKKF